MGTRGISAWKNVWKSVRIPIFQAWVTALSKNLHRTAQQRRMQVATRTRRSTMRNLPSAARWSIHPHREAAVPGGQDKISRHQEEPAPLLSALCIGESRHVSEGRKAERVLDDDGISAPIFPNFPLKRAIREERLATEAILHVLLQCNL